MTIPSNTTPDEFFTYYCTDERAVTFYEKAAINIAKDEAETARLRRRIELAEEQCYFARELIEQIEQAASELNMRDFRKALARFLDNSYFER